MRKGVINNKERELNFSNYRRGILFAVAACVLSPLTSVHAQSYPTKPITLIVPWPAGGASDRHMRLLAELASKQLGQNIIVENKPGAGGTLGPSSMAATAKPDGYTIAQFPLGMLRMPHMQKTSWNPDTDFTYIAGLSGYTFGLVVKSDSPYMTLKDYLEAAKKKPGVIDFGSAGIGTSPHLIMEELANAANVKLNHVPFKGSAELQNSLLGGHVMAASDATSWAKFVDGGQMRLLVTFGDNPTKSWPNVPTAKSLGYDVVSTSPYGIVGPKGMDPAIVKRLEQAFKTALEDPRYIELMDQLNQQAWFKTSSEYQAWAAKTYQNEKNLIDRLGLAAK